MSPHRGQKPLDVLLVEDNPGDVRLMMEALGAGGKPIRLTVARDGEEALAMLKRWGDFVHSPRPSLIVLDLNLPKMDGRELLAEVKEDHALCRIPIVILTSSNAEQDVEKAYALHASCYVIKPIGLDKFMSTMKAIEHFWLGVVRLPAET